MEYKLKLGTTLSFSGEQERDIVVQLESLKKRHKLGDFISSSLRVIFENPDFAQENGLNLNTFGLTDNRKEFFNAVLKKTDDMGFKIDEIYKMALQTYTLATFNKKIGLEDKSKNILMSQFILQKQLSDLCNLLGVDRVGNLYEANKLFDISKNVEDMLEFIITYYDGIISEIKENAGESSKRDDGIDKLLKKVEELESNLEKAKADIKPAIDKVVASRLVEGAERERTRAETVRAGASKDEIEESGDTDDDRLIDFGEIPETKSFDREHADISSLAGLFGLS